MKVVFTAHGWEDYLHWQQHDDRLTRRINELIRDTMRNPFAGLGKPEPLRHEFKGWWSRRIDQEHRLVYRVTGTNPDQQLEIVQCRFHYR